MVVVAQRVEEEEYRDLVAYSPQYLRRPSGSIIFARREHLSHVRHHRHPFRDKRICDKPRFSLVIEQLGKC